MHNVKKTSLLFLISILLMAVVLILFISPITKYMVEKYDKTYTGRKITADWAYVNPFTGYIHLHNIKIYEPAGDSVFLSANGLSLNVAMLKLLSKTYEISEVTFDQPIGVVIQNQRDFNFNDLIDRFSTRDSTKLPVHFNITSLKIMDGSFYYREEQIPILYFIRKLDLESTGKLWNTDTIAAQFSFLQGDGTGTIKGNFTINAKTKDYRFATTIRQFDLKIIQQYLRDLVNYGSFSATLEADVKATGNFTDQEDITATGKLAVTDFHFGKNPKDDYASFDKLILDFVELSPKKRRYIIDSVLLTHPYFKYERYDYLDNIQTMFGKDGANVVAANANRGKFNLVLELARYVKVLSRNFFKSDYKVNRLAIINGDLKFNDFSLNEKFAVDLNPLNITADSIDKDHKRVIVLAHSDIKPYGDVSVTLSINPKDSSDFDMQYHIQKLPAPLFNPYILTSTSFSLDRGTLELTGKWNVRNGIIKSDNHLILLDPRTTKRLRTNDTKWLPIPLIMSFIRERGNAIDYQIPITGNLKDANFHLGDVLLDLLTNIFVKPATIPYGMEVKELENEIEKSLTLKWALHTSSLLPEQEKFIEGMADFLTKNPNASITVHSQQYAIKEKEYQLYFEAKKKYYLMINNKNERSFSREDAEEVNKMFIKDELFVKYLRKQIPDSTVFTILERCARLIHYDTINNKLERLFKKREEVFLSYFKKRKVDSQLKFSEAVNLVPYNGFSLYKIEYEGEFPKNIIKAYRQMQELNDEAPRKKFKADRKQNVNAMQ